MGLHSGSVSLTRFKVIGLKKSYKISDLNENLEPNKAKKLRLEGGKKELDFGWVRPVGLDQEQLASTAHWDLSDSRTDDGFVLRFRIDTRKVPTKLLQMVVKDRVAKMNEKREKPVSGKERRQIMQETKVELLDSCLPNINFIDVFWNADKGRLLLFSNSKKIRELFEQIFYKTFCEPLGLVIAQIDPPLMALNTSEWKDKAVAEAKLEKFTYTNPVHFSMNPTH